MCENGFCGRRVTARDEAPDDGREGRKPGAAVFVLIPVVTPGVNDGCIVRFCWSLRSKPVWLFYKISPLKIIALT